MGNAEIRLDQVDHITVDAIGAPGERVFYIQGRKGADTISLIIEKIQLQSLIVAIDEFLEQIHEKFNEKPKPEVSFREEEMRIQTPVDPKFRVGEMRLEYEVNHDIVNIVAQEMAFSDDEVGGSVVRYGCTRSQLLALARWGAIVVQRGRPICPQCLQPMEPEGHFCPKKNGHKKQLLT